MTAVPSCPRHPGSRVVRDGTYATTSGARRRYRCTPHDGARPHRFTDPLPPPVAATPRGFAYTTAAIADSLVDVGRGLSYRGAARVARTRAGGDIRLDANTVAGWVELFAPTVYEADERGRWPAVVELGSVVFRALGDGNGGDSAFRVLAAVARQRGRPPRVVALEPAPPGPPGWEDFLRTKNGMPAQIVCARDAELLRAVDAVWPPSLDRSPSVFLCHSELARELTTLVRRAGVDPRERYAAAAAGAFASAAAWRRFVATAPPVRIRGLDAWLARNGERIASQLAHGPGVVTTTDAVAQRLSVVRERLASRRGNLRNLERTRRLLMLLQLELNGRADPGRYASLIRAELGRTDGRPASSRVGPAYTT